VVSIEHSRAWADRITARASGNVRVLFHPIDNPTDEGGDSNHPYVKAILEQQEPLPFSVIVVDGMYRDACALVAAEHVADDGIVIFDNSDRPAHSRTVSSLMSLGFWRLDFEGFVPAYGTLSTTSVFGRGQTDWLVGDAAIRCSAS
jgi:hypothetical protein